MKSLSSLPPGLFCSYYRNQEDTVKEALRKAIGIFPSSEHSKINSSKEIITQKENAL